MIDRRAFLACVATGVLTTALPPYVACAQADDVDPASSAARPRLRVLLGRGDATADARGGFTFEGRAYTGTFARLDDGSVVNTVDLEEYLRSVVPQEMSPSWPSAALQAQAICSRAYVLQRSDPRRPYDVVPSELDQVYHGVASWTAATDAAVMTTAAQILRVDDGFAQIAYSSCCGGRTEAASDAWGGTPLPYLQSIVCPYCTDSPEYRWQRAFAPGALDAAFAPERSNAGFGAIRSARVAQADASGRAQRVELVTDHGVLSVKATAFRARAGARLVRSLLIAQLSLDAVAGNGLGHGVGLCQWGAHGFARTGASARDILAFYFPGTVLAHA